MPASAATREWSVTYGGFALSSANSCYLDSATTSAGLETLAYPEGVFSCEFAVISASTGVAATDNTTHNTARLAVETALRKPDQRLTVTISSQTRVDWNPSSSARTAFRIRATLREIEQVGLVTRYRFEVRAALLADLSGAGARTTEAFTEAQTLLEGRRVVIAQASWTADADETALQKYTSGGDTYFATVLPTTTGEWLNVREDPRYDNENAILTVTRTYWEITSGGLREYKVSVSYSPAQIRTVTITGLYTKTASTTAKANHDAGITTLVSNVMSTLGITNYDKNKARVDGYETTAQTYAFTQIRDELSAAQSDEATDDTNAVDATIEVQQITPIFPRALLGSIQAQPLAFCRAVYETWIDVNSTGATDPKALWVSKYKNTALARIQSKLGASNFGIEREEVRVDIIRSRLVATVEGFSRGSDVLALAVTEVITETTGTNPVPYTTGRAHSFWVFKRMPTKRLSRVAVMEAVIGGNVPTLFAPGDRASGWDLVNTGKTYKQALADQAQDGWAPSPPCWIAMDVPGGGLTYEPSTRGANGELSTVRIRQVEEWLYCESGEADRTATGSASGGQTRSR